ncbi:nucleotidyltransferase family protein [Tropicimonas sp. IMCC34043]|uniref:nucleotidyltransferase family protein n=1 Tax=Tropicimonas sp. IMCC34043 TaxID=2248760 RepID=UPI000E23B15A|nr:nucleotidyltransferase family protein [Tropicimonas sp. IMCC34043]
MRDLPDTVMLFAAGFGTRMGALTRTRPKPLIAVAGRPLLTHALNLAEAAGIARKVVNTHYLGSQIAAFLAGQPDIAISHESPQILETGGGLKHALPLLDGSPVFTLNTDAVWTGDNPFDELRAAWDPARMDALLLLVDPQDARGHSGKGDFRRGSGGQLSRGAGEIYAGAQILNTALLSEVAEPAFSLNLLWDRMLARGRLFGCLHRGGWCDVGRPEGIAVAEAMLAEAGNA